jgi:hypothetical protein
MHLRFYLTLVFTAAFSVPTVVGQTSVSFNFHVEDHAAVSIDGKSVGSYDNPHAAGNIVFTPKLTPGWHSLAIDYANQLGTNCLALRSATSNGYSIIPRSSFRSLDQNGNYVSGLRADYYSSLGGPYLFTAYGEGPIDHCARSSTEEIYQGVPGLWAGVFGPFAIFEERLNGEILVGGCQVNVPQTFGQADGYPGYWGGTQYAFDVGATMQQLGCATSALSMAHESSGISAIPLATGSSLSQCASAGSGLQSTNPGTLNCFMVQQGQGVDYDSNNFVDWDQTTRDVSRAANTGQLSYFDTTSIGGSSSPSDLQTAVCQGNAVVVKVAPVNSCQVQPGSYGHYVLVTGAQQNGDGTYSFPIIDPGCQAITSLSSYGNDFVAVGFVSDPVDVSGLDLRVGGNSDILVTDQLGSRTGFDANIGQVLKGIPNSSYLQDFLTDDTTGLQATPVSHSVQLLRPAQQSYQILLTGINQGSDTLVIHAFAQDGTEQSLSIPLATSIAGSSTYQVQYSPVPGTTPAVSLTNLSVSPGLCVPFPVSLGTAAGSNGAFLTLTTSDPTTVALGPGIVSPTITLFIPAGATTPNQRTPEVCGVNVGSATVTASGATLSSSNVVMVQVIATLTFAQPSVTGTTTAQARVTLSLSGPAPAGGVTVNLSSDNPAVATVPSTVTIPANTTSVVVPITGVAAGSTTIHAIGLWPQK